MDFFGMGTGEILLVVIVALLLWGPAKLPEIARTVGKTISSLRQTGSELTTQIKKELEAEELKEKKHAPVQNPTLPQPPKPPTPESTSTTSGED